MGPHLHYSMMMNVCYNVNRNMLRQNCVYMLGIISETTDGTHCRGPNRTGPNPIKKFKDRTSRILRFVRACVCHLTKYKKLEKWGVVDLVLDPAQRGGSCMTPMSLPLDPPLLVALETG